MKTRDIMASALMFHALALLPLAAFGQTTSGAADKGELPRTADGRPDIQGVWDFGSVTPLQRPTELADRAFLSEEDVSALEAQAAARVDRPPRQADPGS